MSEPTFIPYRPDRLDPDQVVQRSTDFYELMEGRRSVRMFSPDPVPREAIERAVAATSIVPYGAHRQPWTFVLIGDADTKRQIRLAAEEEERTNYEGGRLPDDWLEALRPLGTGWHKEFLESVTWIVVLFEQRYGLDEAGNRLKHFYVKESVGIACGILIAALHHMGLATLTHTPSPMAFLTKLLGRPKNERPFAMLPIGYPADDCVVPDLTRKGLDDVLVVFG
jgi:nitroreductase